MKVRTFFFNFLEVMFLFATCPPGKGKFGQKWCLKCVDLKMRLMQSFFLLAQFLWVFFGQVWENLGENPSQPPKICLLLHLCLRHFCFKQSQINISGTQVMQLAVSVFPNVLGNQMSKERRIQDEGHKYKTFELRVPLC